MANKKESGVASAGSLFSSYRVNAKKRGLDFTLTFEQFIIITTGVCYLCGKEPSQEVKGRHRNGSYIYNGIDRLDNAKGYIFENAKACCKTCNRMKFQLSLDELLRHIRQILTLNG